MSPLCESYLTADQLNLMEPHYPLRAFVCGSCFLVQLEEFVPPEEIFREYAYFSSYADSWLEHARSFVGDIAHRLNLSPESQVVEVASNDGYLLQYFLPLNIPVLGVEPARNVAAAGIEKGIPTRVDFFNSDLAEILVQDGYRADLVIANNVLAQVTDLNDFVAGLRTLLKAGGVLTLEFPHLLRLIDGNQFDTIYHEHFSYFSFLATERILAAHGLRVFDVEELATHGGSLRIFACRSESPAPPQTVRVNALRELELVHRFDQLHTYSNFGQKVAETKRKILGLLIEAKAIGKQIVGYGAPGKGNTLLNYCGIRSDFLDYTVDKNPFKQGKYLPGSHIPIYPPERIFETRPDYVLILPWNVKDEIIDQMGGIRAWGGKFIIPIPEACIYPS
jgi:SAM-dependent methyltransferase